ncbi:hypothetical protein D910_08537 [Dendroctonus ponderosae]|uniref:Uncharacterized protein n=1 Tax=Dendroctonus ponderosae TaxID=77166 RepID=U4UFQ5_DENPD|nr:hypothetical protein D910_08537 [Dendroctonus ponderosae]
MKTTVAVVNHHCNQQHVFMYDQQLPYNKNFAALHFTACRTRVGLDFASDLCENRNGNPDVRFHMFPHGAIMFQHWMDVVNNLALSKLAHTTVIRFTAACEKRIASFDWSNQQEQNDPKETTSISQAMQHEEDIETL